MRKEASAMKAVKEWNVFTYNFPYGFIRHCWRDNPNLANHFESKFNGLYKSYGSHGVMLAFCAELDGGNYDRMIEYVVSGEWRECDKWMAENHK
jgi:hypothetical protein